MTERANFQAEEADDIGPLADDEEVVAAYEDDAPMVKLWPAPVIMRPTNAPAAADVSVRMCVCVRSIIRTFLCYRVFWTHGVAFSHVARRGVRPKFNARLLNRSNTPVTWRSCPTPQIKPASCESAGKYGKAQAAC